VKLSVCIPYKARLDNLRITLEALVQQTMGAADFEVIIGAMEYSAELTTAVNATRPRTGGPGRANAARFLRTWPRRDVELTYVFGDTRANDLWPDYRADLARAEPRRVSLQVIVDDDPLAGQNQ
jgi:hypothetical protein